MYPGQSALVDWGGINRTLYNAQQEGGQRNGVLTGVEDFMAQSQQSLELLQIPGFHGLGVLYPPELRHKNRRFDHLVLALTLSSGMREHLERVEISRLCFIAQLANEQLYHLKHSGAR